MATIDQSSRYDPVLRRQQAEHDLAREERQALWIFLWVLFGFKTISAGILIWWIEWDEFVYVVGLTSWPWIVIPGIALSGPILSRLRMRRVRKKRAALRQAEFGIDPGSNAGLTTVSSLFEAPRATIVELDEIEPDGERKEPLW